MADELNLPREEGESLLAYGKRRAKALGLHVAVPAPAPVTWDSDLVPEVTMNLPPEVAQERLEIDSVLGRIDIVEAYNRWCKKMHVDPAGKRESIMVSCPNPAHPDRNPSSWLTLDKGDGGVGYCEPCQLGYDKYDIAAWRFGFDVPGYKGSDFPELRRKMATDLGYTVVVQGKDEWLSRSPEQASPQPVEVPERAPVPGVDVGPPVFPATGERTDEAVTSPGTTGPTSTPSLSVAVEIDQTFAETPTVDWRDLGLLPDSFLARWMETTSVSYEPEEFYLWEGLMALACASGNNVKYDDTIPVRPNLMVCLIGSTGTGKSISISVFEELIRRALPWDTSSGGGTRMVSSPGSGEALLDEFQHCTTDPVTKKIEFFPVNGLYRESELASFVKRTARPGNTMRELIMDLYDRSHPVSSVSRGRGSVTASDHFMQMITSTQNVSIQSLLTQNDAGAGFLNRWVFAFGGTKVRPPRNAVRIDVSPVVDLLRQVRGWGSPGQQVQFIDGSPAAALWDEFYMDKVHPLTIDEDAWMAARLPLLAKKLVLLFAVNDHSTVIELRHVQSLIAMWEYLLRSYGIVATQVGVDDLEDCCNRIEEYLAFRTTESFTIREISKQSSARRYKKETIQRAVELLVKTSMIDEVPRSKSDRVIRYTYSSHAPVQLSAVPNIARS